MVTRTTDPQYLSISVTPSPSGFFCLFVFCAYSTLQTPETGVALCAHSPTQPHQPAFAPQVTCVPQLLSFTVTQRISITCMSSLASGIPPARVVKLKESGCRIRLQVEKKRERERHKTSAITKGSDMFTWKLLNRRLVSCLVARMFIVPCPVITKGLMPSPASPGQA